MTEDVGKIRIGCEVDSSGAKRGIDDLYKAIRSLNKSINSLISSKSISIGLQIENNAESALLNEVTRVTDNISKSAKVSVDFRIDGDGLERVSAGAVSVAETLSKSVSTEFEIKKYADTLYDLEYIVNRITYSDKASKFFKSLSGDIASFCAKVAPFMPGVDKYAIVMNNLAVCVNNLSDVGDGASNFFKSLKKYNTALSKVGDMNNSAGLFVQSMQTLSDGVSSLRSAGDVSGTLKPIKSTIGLLNKVNDMSIDTNKADSISNSLKSLGEGVSLLRGSGDVSGSLKPVRSTIGLLNKVNDISVDTTKTESISNSLKSLGEGVLSLRNAGDISGNLGSFKLIFKLLNKVNDISVDATKTESMSNSLKLLGEGVSSLRDAGDISGNLGSFKLAFKLLNKINDMSVDATKVGSISNSLKALSEGVSSLSTVGDISESLGYIKSTLKILNKLNETNVDSSQVASIGSSISALVSTISSIKVPKKAADVLSLMDSVKGVLMGIKAIGSADSNIDVSKISSIIVALMNTFASIDVPNSGADITKLMESIKGIASIFTVIGKLDTGSIDNAKIEAIATSVSNLVSRLSSINIPENAAQIIELANAIKTLSSASAGTSNSSKTTSLFDRLSSGAGKTLGVIRKLIGVVKNLHSKIKGVHTVADKMGNAIKKSYTELYSKIKLITGAIKTFINTFKNFDSAYSKQLSAETRLSVAMSNSTNATKEQIQEVKDLTAEYQQLGILGDEVQLTGLQELSTYVESTESIKKLLPIMNDMTAQQFGFEATTENAFTIATALGKVLNGNTDTLKRYGYAFNDAQKQILKYGTEEQKVAVLTEVVSSAVGGMNNAMANTPTGRITQLKNNFGDLKESIGELLNYVVLPFAKSINEIILRIMQGVKSLTAFIKEALGIKTVTKEVKTLLDTSSNKTANSLDGVSDSLDDTASSADNTKKKVKNLLGSFDELNILSESTSSNLDDSSDALDSLSLGQGVTDTIEVPDLNDFKKRLSALFDSLDFEKLGLNFAEKINEYIDKWNPASSGAALADKLNKLIKFANAGLKNIKFKQLGQKIGAWVNNFVGTFDSKQLGNSIATLINQAVAFANGLLTETDFKALGESIGTYINELFTNIDTDALADLIINTVEAAVATAAGIISKIDFKEIGKGLARGVNKLSQSKSTWVKAARAIGDAIIGVLDLAIGFIDDFDAEAFGESLGAFIANLKWGEILTKAGEAIVKALWTVIKINIGMYKDNPFAGVMTTLVGALAGLNIATGTIKGIQNLGKALGRVVESIRGLRDAGGSGVISKLAKSVGEFVTAHPAVAIIAAVGTALSGIAIGIASIYGDYIKNKSEWETYLTTVSALSSEQEAFVKSTKESNDKIKDINKAIKESGDAADKEASKFETLFGKLSNCVDEYGNIKKGCEEYANYLVNELNRSYDTNLENIDGQIKGYSELCGSIDKYIAKLKAKAIIQANEDNYAEALTEYKKANRDIIDAQIGYEESIQDMADLASDVEKMYKLIFEEGINLDGLKNPADIKALQSALEEIGGVVREWGYGSLDLLPEDNELTRELKRYYKNIDALGKKYNKAISHGDKYVNNITELGAAIHNNSFEFLKAKSTALDTIDTTKAQVENYELLSKTLNDTTSSVQDINAALNAYTSNTVVSRGRDNLKEIQAAWDEWQTRYNETVQMIKNKDLRNAALEEMNETGEVIKRQMALSKADIAEGVATWTEEATKKLFESERFGSEADYLKWYAKLFGEEHIPAAIESLSKVTGASPESIAKQYLKNNADVSAETVQQIINKYLPDNTDETVSERANELFKSGMLDGYKKYLESNPDITDEQKKAVLKKYLPSGTSQDVVDIVYKALKDTITSGVDKTNKELDDNKPKIDVTVDVNVDANVNGEKDTFGEYLKNDKGDPFGLKKSVSKYNKFTKFEEIGQNITRGIQAGINSEQKNLNSTAENSANDILKTQKTALGIASPSKKTREIGEYLDIGLANGIKGALNKILDATKYVCDRTIDAFRITGMNASMLKNYAYAYVSNFFNSIALRGTELNKVYSITDKVVSAFKITLWNSGILTKYGNAYVDDYAKGVVLSDANKKKITGIQTIIITLLKPSTNTLNSAKTYGSSILQNMINGMTVSDNNRTSISNAGITIYNSMINSMNGLTGKLSTSSANFIGYLTNPITNGLKLLLDSMDLFYIKFRDKWQGVANLFNNKFIAGSMGVSKVPNLNENYYPFGNNIVKLAQGAVIKPNNEFMAILGDQKRGVNIETPLATMKQAFIEALNDGGYSGGNITIPVYIGNEKIDTLIVNSNNRRGMRNNGRV